MTPSTSTPHLRPLGIGELIDRSAVLWRQHLGTLFKLYLVYQLLTFILGKANELLVMRRFALFRGGPEAAALLESDPEGAMWQAGAALLAIVPLLFVTIWFGWCVSVVGSDYVIRGQLGERSTLSDGIARARSRLGTVTGAYLISSLWGVGLAVAAAVPGGAIAAAGLFSLAEADGAGRAGAAIALVVGTLLLLLGILVAILWWMLRFLLTPQVIALENVSAWEAVRRSGALLRGRVGPGFMNLVKVRATILLTLVMVILFAVSLFSSIPLLIVQFVYGDPTSAAGTALQTAPQALLVPAQLLQVLVQAVFVPLYLVFTALFYVDMRVRREGLDLELQLARGAAPVSSA